MRLSRRKLLHLGTASLFTPLSLPLVSETFAKTAIHKKIDQLTGKAKAVENKVVIKIPEIASHGNSIPIKVEVESQMTADNYIESITLIGSDHPDDIISKFHFSVMSGKAEVNTNIRSDRNQEIIALAKTSNNDFFIGRRLIKVYIKREF